MLLVYTHKITPRLRYVFKQICTRTLCIPVQFTTEVASFVSHSGLKISYTKKPLGNEFFIQSHSLLFEHDISDTQINIQMWDETKCFFKQGEKSNLPFDIFAASFYLLSRYEEYLPHVKDDFGRFPAHESIAYKNNFLHQPVVDIWAYKFLKAIKERFPNIEFQERTFVLQPIIDVPLAYQYKSREFIRTLVGILRDTYQFEFRKIVERIRVLLGLKRDPYDTFKWIVNTHKTKSVKPIFFFLLADFSNHDRNINFKNADFTRLIKSIGDYAKVGLKVSYAALDNLKLLKIEKQRIEAILNRPVELSRNSFTKVNLPFTYRNLIDVEISEDYTLGYTTDAGFRAGTCTPFYFYDIDYEIQTPLKINSFHMLDYMLLKEETMQAKVDAFLKIIKEVKRVNGKFSPVFHNYTFSENKQWNGFKKIYLELLKEIDET
jgi:hypothetical protein